MPVTTATNHEPAVYDTPLLPRRHAGKQAASKVVIDGTIDVVFRVLKHL